nr:hypothetical protein [Tanacetum cinerariifolium]
FFKVDEVPDGRKIQLASMHMFDVALVWYQQYVKKYPDNTLWEHFVVEVVKRFGVLYDDPIVELKNSKQTGSVQHYQGVFKALLNKVDLPEPIALARMQEATNTILKPRYNTPLLPTPKQSTPTTTYANPIQAALAVIQETLSSIQAEVKLHSTEIASLKRGEGTSQPRTDE